MANIQQSTNAYENWLRAELGGEIFGQSENGWSRDRERSLGSLQRNRLSAFGGAAVAFGVLLRRMLVAHSDASCRGPGRS